MQKIVCSYTEQLIPVAVNMCKHLVETFAQVLEGMFTLLYLLHQLFAYIIVISRNFQVVKMTKKPSQPWAY